MGAGQVRCDGARRLAPRLTLPPSPPPRDHDGRFTLDDLIALAAMCRRRSRCYQSFEYSAQLQGFCSLHLWQAMAAPNGRDAYVNW